MVPNNVHRHNASAHPPGTGVLLSLLRTAGLLFACVGLTAAGLESVRSGHTHVAHGRALHHHHVHGVAHEHPGSGHDDQPRGPDSPDHRKQKSATVSAAPALFLPAGIFRPAAPLAAAVLLRPAAAPPRLLLDLARLLPPRAPPSFPSLSR